MRTFAACLVGLALGLIGPARAASAEDAAPADATAEAVALAQRFAGHLGGSRFDEAVETLTDAAIERLASVPDQAAVVCRDAAVNGHRLYLVAPKAWIRFEDRIGRLAKGASEGAAPGSAGERCGASARILSTCFGFLRKQGADPAALKRDIATLHLPSKAAPLSPGDWRDLIDGLRLTGPPDVELFRVLADESAVLEKASPAEKNVPELAARNRLYLGLLLASDHFDEAKRHLEKALVFFGPAASSDPKDVSLSHNINLALTLLRESGATVKGDYRGERGTTGWRMLQFRLPIGMGWTYTWPKEVGQEQVTIHRKREGRDEVTITVWAYKWWTVYNVGNRDIGGENAMGLLKSDYDAAKLEVRKVTRDVKGAAGKLSPTIKDAVGFELKGLDFGDAGLHIRDWYFRAALHPEYTLNVSLRREGIFVDKDPELQFILESFEEVPSGPK